ncbi:Ig-like domain-containing protein [Pontibacillus sp. HMF3514]|uniref:Ig-like domain-containing protein n=1 Tax=Pontibacillus sp. HMF3514 TaxID=2692425 RepID=UPI00131FAC6C|nr:Ig-like domain-containing protein [Pontibacillus sp. HMF3514]QHE51063.1 transglycosylase SLT domain-containing protein [Pontibacillus sp. HMF3514]
MKWAKSLILTLVIMTFGFAGNVDAAEGDYEELSWEKKHELLTNIAIEYNIPPEILKAIATVESDMMQFKDGEIRVSDDGGIGMMQITNSDFDFDEEKLKTDTAYNIEAGAKILDAKWKLMDSGNLPEINGANNRHIIEQWYFPIMAYNGVSNRNNPDNEDIDITYQKKVFNIIENKSFVDIAETPDKFGFGLENGDLKFNDLEYKWEEADAYTTQMFEKGDKVFVMNNVDLNVNDLDYGNLRSQLDFSSAVTMRVPYYTELEITGGPYFENSTFDNQFITYKVEGSNISGYMSSSNLHPMDSLQGEINWEEAQNNVAIDKTWEVEMSTQIDPASVNERNVYMVREDGVGIRSDVSLTEDGKHILVEPQYDYMPGQKYTLHIKDLISEQLGNKMKKTTAMNFEVEQAYTDQLEEDQVNFKASLNQKTFSEDDRIRVTATIENNGDEAYIHQGSSTCDDEIFFFIQQDGERAQFVGTGDVAPRDCTTDMVNIELEAGEKRTAYATFDLETEEIGTLDPTTEAAKSGEYTLIARYGDKLIEMPFVVK